MAGHDCRCERAPTGMSRRARTRRFIDKVVVLEPATRPPRAEGENAREEEGTGTQRRSVRNVMSVGISRNPPQRDEPISGRTWFRRRPMQNRHTTDRDTGRPRGFAFVDYDDRGVAERAIQQLHGQPFKGRPLSVSEARPREARPPMGSGGGFSAPRPPMGGAPRPPMGGSPLPDAGNYRQPRSGDPNRNFGPNKPPKGRGGSNFAKNRNQEGKARGPLKGSQRPMFSVDEDSRFAMKTTRCRRRCRSQSEGRRGEGEERRRRRSKRPSYQRARQGLVSTCKNGPCAALAP